MENVAIKDSENNRSFVLSKRQEGEAGAVRQSYSVSPLRAKKLQIFCRVPEQVIGV